MDDRKGSVQDRERIAPEAGSARVLCAADVRLDRTLSGGEGMAAIPFPRLRNATFEALRRLVDHALEESASSVLFTGVLCDPACGFKVPSFLAEQLARLTGAGIPCCLADGSFDFSEPRWRAALSLPLVHRVRKDGVVALKDGGAVSLPALARFAGCGPLQGCSPKEEGPHGAWLVSLNGETPSGKEFVPCDALRWISRELAFSAEGGEWISAWEKTREELRAESEGRPVLARVKITGMTGGGRASGEKDFIRDSGARIQSLNAGEAGKENFVVVDSLEIETPEAGQWSLGLEKFSGGRHLEADFLRELSAFKSQIDPRLTLIDVLKERAPGKRVTEEAALLLEKLTDSDIDLLLRDSYALALSGLFGDEADLDP